MCTGEELKARVEQTGHKVDPLKESKTKNDVMFRSIKKELRIVGIDDCPFVPRECGTTGIVGIVFRGGYWLDGVMRTKVDIDGFNATQKIAEMVRSSPHFKQIRVIMLDGITFAGFNVVDIRELFESTNLSVLALTREDPSVYDVREAIKKLPRWRERWQIIQKAGKMYTVEIGDTRLHMQIAGTSIEDAEKIVRMSCTRGNIPEPLRVAHIVASGLAELINQ